MRKRIIAGNWKMFKTASEVEQFTDALQSEIQQSTKVDVVICPPALYIANLVQATKNTPVNIGAQTMHNEKEGAFTGEISPTMLTSVGAKYVIIGHSERRQYFNETDEWVNAKTIAALEEGITPIVCVGESLEERDAGVTVSTVEEQVSKAFANIAAADVEKIVIAYEPIWAIGTGKTATADDANEVCGAIRHAVATLYNGEAANKVRIQYGGSVNPANIDELLSKEHIDGALVGGASLQTESFLQLIEAGSK